MIRNKTTLLRRAVSLLCALCLLAACAPAALAGSVGSSPAAVTASATKTYVKLPNDVELFTTDTYTGSGSTVVKAGTVLQLVSPDTYTAGGLEYACLYYNSARYNARYADISAGIMSAADTTSYIVGTLWTATSFDSMRRDMNLTGNVRVHGLQLALSVLGYYANSIDGNFGTGTESAVKAFQRAYKLTVDGRAGPITQKLLYPLAISAYNGGSTGGTPSGGTSGGTATSSGTLKTTASVNLRKTASTKSPRLAVVPKNASLPYYQSTTVSGTTWYYVTYNSLNGWIMGNYTSLSSSGGSTSGGTSATQIGTVTITKKNTRVRKTPNGTKTGIVLALDSQVPLMAQPTTAGGYTWYYIKTTSNVYGYVRGDCATASTSGGGTSGGEVTPSSAKTYVKLSRNVTLFTSTEQSATGAVAVSAGTVLQMVSPVTYTAGGVTYCSLYYNNVQYNCLYSDVSAD
ncbi:MAG: peptidoglycan-binding protein, partial [Eubacteriales bacterium]|nr:peptidoglycan-binding protein [Eubacteriales bacterium]